jgi:hypothetical protein
MRNHCSRIFSVCLFVLLYSGQLFAQPSIKLFKSLGISKSNTNAFSLSIEPHALLSVFNYGHIIIEAIPLPQSSGMPESADLDLTEFSVLGEHTHIYVVENGVRVPVDLPTVRTYRGKVKGDPNSLAYIAIQPNGTVSGYIRFDNRENYDITPSLSREKYISTITPVSAISGFSAFTRCAADDETKYAPKLGKVQPLSTDPKPLAAARTAIVGCDADKECNDLFGSVDETKNFVAAAMAGISAVYESEVDVAISIGDLNVFTDGDPYPGNTLDQILTSFSGNYHGADNRTIAHLFSGKDIPSGYVGLASLDALCNSSRGYGVSDVASFFHSSLSVQFVAAHEMGHNFGSYHTHNCSSEAFPPSGIDHCVGAEGGCSWSPTQVKGSIMSYCTSKNFSFKTPTDPQGTNTRVIEVLKAGAEAATCLVASAKMTLNDSVVNFPLTNFGSAKDTTIKAIITNTGSDADLKITGVTFDGTNGNEFQLKNPPQFPVTLSFNQSLDLTITFKPGDEGDRIANMHILHNAQGASSSVTLNGTGAAPVVLATNTTLDFGNIKDYDAHDSSVFYVNNVGSGPLTITKDSILTKQTDFTVVSGGKGLVIAPGDSGKLVVRFKAKTDGHKEVLIAFKSNAPSSSGNTFTDVTVSADVHNVIVGSVSSVNDEQPQIILSPNPFGRQLQIELHAPDFSGQSLAINIFDNLGREVGKVTSGKLNSSEAKFFWQPEVTIAEGTYTLIARIGAKEIIKQIVYIK